MQVLHLLREQLAKSDAVGVITCERVGNIADDDWVIVMKGGVVVQSGTHRHLVEERGCYRDMHGIPDPLHPFPTLPSGFCPPNSQSFTTLYVFFLLTAIPRSEYLPYVSLEILVCHL